MIIVPPPPVVVLTGDAMAGYQPTKKMQRFAVQNGPHVVRLGRQRPKSRSMNLSLEDYVTPEVMRALPESIDWTAAAQASIDQMLGNDVEGCCVIASSYHIEGSATAADGGPVIIPDPAEAHEAYQTICGPGDNGCNMEEVLKWQMTKGLKFRGAVRKIDGYVAIPIHTVELAKAAVFLFGNIKIGFNLPAAWTSAAIWDVTNTQIVGGHDVPALGFNKDGLVIASWARKYLVTWNAWQDRRFADEAYVVLSPGWYGSDRVAPNKFPVAALQADLAKLKAGQIPDTTPPIDPPPPQPPTPIPLPAVTVSGSCSINGVQVSFQVPMAAGEIISNRGTASARRPTKVGEVQQSALPDDDEAHEQHKPGGGQLPGTHV